MPIRTENNRPGITEVIVDHPPVNALDVAGWFSLADALLAAGRDPECRVVILRAEGRGFTAGVDIKEPHPFDFFNFIGNKPDDIHVAAFGKIRDTFNDLFHMLIFMRDIWNIH